MTIFSISKDAEQYARCRTSWQGHRWDDAPAPPINRAMVPKGWMVVSFRCERCHMRKYYLFNPENGETSKPRYSHRPQHYHAPGSTRADWKKLFALQYLNTKTKKKETQT